MGEPLTGKVALVTGGSRGIGAATFKHRELPLPPLMSWLPIFADAWNHLPGYRTTWVMLTLHLGDIC
jgi:hypothetical protein